MACPSWTKSNNQPVDLITSMASIKEVLGNEKYFAKHVEIGGKEVVTYMKVLQLTAKHMKKKRWIFSIPFFSLGMSKLWVGLFSGSSTNFVSPLIESLRHDMTLKDSSFMELVPNFSLSETIIKALDKKVKIPQNPYGITVSKDKNTVRSVADC